MGNLWICETPECKKQHTRKTTNPTAIAPACDFCGSFMVEAEAISSMELAYMHERIAELEPLEKLAKYIGRHSMVDNMTIVMHTGHFGNCEWYRGGKCTCGGNGRDIDYAGEIKKYSTMIGE